MLSNIRTIKDLDVNNKKVLVRADLNLPIVHGKITDLTRLTRIIPTLQYLLENNAKVILISHYGQPKGKFVLDLSLSPVVDELSKALQGLNVLFDVDILADSTKSRIDQLEPGNLLLIENLRFHPGEELNDLEFARQVAELGDIYVNETFSCSHREHASIVSLPKFLPGIAGLLLFEELEKLQEHLTTPTKKVMSITGGSKISSKINMLTALVEKTDYLVIGGAMANTFLKAKGHSIGNSLYEENYIDTALSILNKATKSNCEIILPTDMITAKTFTPNASYQVRSLSNIPDDEMILDIGPKFLATIIFKLDEVKTVIWNGPLGAFEHKPFDLGTTTISRAIAAATLNQGLISIAGGGDVVSAINSSGLSDNFTYISTGGGAFLKWIENQTLPGIEALIENAKIYGCV
jgi:phosphoglycerate kinase